MQHFLLCGCASIGDVSRDWECPLRTFTHHLCKRDSLFWAACTSRLTSASTSLPFSRLGALAILLRGSPDPSELQIYATGLPVDLLQDNLSIYMQFSCVIEGGDLADKNCQIDNNCAGYSASS